LDHIKSRRNWRYATDTTMKPDAVAMLSSVIILILRRHTMAIGRRRLRCFRWRNRHRERRQSQCEQE
jgi:hypothetical protein